MKLHPNSDAARRRSKVQGLSRLAQAVNKGEITFENATTGLCPMDLFLFNALLQAFAGNPGTGGKV